MSSISLAQRDSICFDVLIPGDHHVGDLCQLSIANLLLHPIVDLNTNPTLCKGARNLIEVVDVAIGDRPRDCLAKR